MRWCWWSAAVDVDDVEGLVRYWAQQGENLPRKRADIIRSITEGVGGVMPAFETVFNSETDIENLKNFIQSLWPADQRPAVE